MQKHPEFDYDARDRLYKALVEPKPYLFWGVGDKQGLSIQSIIETIIANGDFDDFKILIEILGMEKVAEVFRIKIQNSRHNFRNKTVNFFQLYFDKHVPRYSDK